MCVLLYDLLFVDFKNFIIIFFEFYKNYMQMKYLYKIDIYDILFL